jgi:hypothetical protein
MSSTPSELSPLNKMPRLSALNFRERASMNWPKLDLERSAPWLSLPDLLPLLQLEVPRPRRLNRRSPRLRKKRKMLISVIFLVNEK